MNMINLCNRSIVSIDAGASLQQAASLMRSEHVGALVVTTGGVDEPHAVGLVTDRDLTIEAMACQLDPEETVIGDIASRELVVVSADSGIADALTVMAAAGVRRILVTESDRRVVGMVSFDDLVAALADEMSNMVKCLQKGTEREVRERNTFLPLQPPLLIALNTPGMA